MTFRTHKVALVGVLTSQIEKLGVQYTCSKNTNLIIAFLNIQRF